MTHTIVLAVLIIIALTSTYFYFKKKRERHDNFRCRLQKLAGVGEEKQRFTGLPEWALNMKRQWEAGDLHFEVLDELEKEEKINYL